MRELKLLTGTRVVVASDGAAVRGILESATKEFVTLVDATDVSSPQAAPILGSVLIPSPRIQYVQAVS